MSFMIQEHAYTERHLYMSGQEAAVDHQLHRTMRFKLVMNCTNHLPFIQPKTAGTTYFKVAIEDNLRQKEINDGSSTAICGWTDP